MTYNDFDGVGSGSGELAGAGQVLFGVACGHNVIVVESDAIGFLSQTGNDADPWDYRRIENFRVISNICVYESTAYMIGSDGLLYATNGISDPVAVNTPFDLTLYTDVDTGEPMMLVFSEGLRCLVAFKYDVTLSDAQVAFLVDQESGPYTSLDVGGARIVVRQTTTTAPAAT